MDADAGAAPPAAEAPPATAAAVQAAEGGVAAPPLPLPAGDHAGEEGAEDEDDGEFEDEDEDEDESGASGSWTGSDDDGAPSPQDGESDWGDSDIDAVRPSLAEQATHARLLRTVPVRTHVSHRQCADAVCAAGGSLVVAVQLLPPHGRLTLVDAATGELLAIAPSLPFDVYSIAADPQPGGGPCWVVAVGCGRHGLGGAPPGANAALLRLVPPPNAALQLETTFGVGGIDETGAALQQANSVRFGWCLGAEPEAAAAAAADGAAALPPPPPTPPPAAAVRVLLVGSQDGRVHALAAPSSGPPFRCAPLASLAAPVPVNYAQGSPDGAMLAGCGDREEVYLWGRGWHLGTAGGPTLRLPLSPAGRAPPPHAGCQYVAWSGCGTRLAASSDSLCAVCVWAVVPADGSGGGAPAAVPLARFTRHGEWWRPGAPPAPHPCLALCFLPASTVLCWATRESCAFLADVDAVAAAAAAGPAPATAWARPLAQDMGGAHLRACGVQRVRLAARGAQPPEARRVTGAAILPWAPAHGGCGGGGGGAAACTLALATGPALALFEPLSAWSRATNSLWPPAFRAATRALLLCAASRHAAAECGAEEGAPGGAAGLWDLPRDLLVTIVALAAHPQTAWLPPRPAPEAEEALFLGRPGERWRRVGERLRRARLEGREPDDEDDDVDFYDEEEEEEYDDMEGDDVEGGAFDEEDGEEGDSEGWVTDDGD